MNDRKIIAAFSEDHAERLTGISKRQLRYWDRTNFFSPSMADENRRLPNSRVYSFRDVVCLKVLNALRNDAGVSLHQLRDVKEKLAHLGDDMWAKTTLYVLNRKIIFFNPESSKREEVVSGQVILEIPLQVVQGNMERAVELLWERDEKSVGSVERKRGTVNNKPVVGGTRIPVKAIKAFKDAGYTIDQIQEQYPILTKKDIRAALEYGKAA